MTTKNFTISAKFNYGLFWIISLLLVVGIFLCPNSALASEITPEKIIELTNRKRTEKSLNTLTRNPHLTRAARKKAEFLLKNQVFKHNTADKKFSHWIQETGYDYSYIGENLAVDFTGNEEVINSWLDSPSHKKNLLYPKYREIGAAVVSGTYEGHESTLVVQIFGAPPSSKTKTDKQTSDPQASTAKTDTTKKDSDSSFWGTGVKASTFSGSFAERDLGDRIGTAVFAFLIFLFVALIYLLPAAKLRKTK